MTRPNYDTARQARLLELSKAIDGAKTDEAREAARREFVAVRDQGIAMQMIDVAGAGERAFRL